MAKAIVYTNTGTKKAAKNLPENFNTEINEKLLAQAIRVYEWQSHTGSSKTKTRGEVEVSTRKIFRQKGTGNARHGSISAPIFVGGGVAHGPTGIKRSLNMPKAMKRKARDIALSKKAKDGKVILLEGLNNVKKTKEAAKVVSRIVSELNVKKNSRFTLVLKDLESPAFKSFRNLENLKIVLYKDLNAYSIFLGGMLLIDSEVFEKEKKTTKKTKPKKTETKK